MVGLGTGMIAQKPASQVDVLPVDRHTRVGHEIGDVAQLPPAVRGRVVGGGGPRGGGLVVDIPVEAAENVQFAVHRRALTFVKRRGGVGARQPLDRQGRCARHRANIFQHEHGVLVIAVRRRLKAQQVAVRHSLASAVLEGIGAHGVAGGAGVQAVQAKGGLLGVAIGGQIDPKRGAARIESGLTARFELGVQGLETGGGHGSQHLGPGRIAVQHEGAVRRGAVRGIARHRAQGHLACRGALEQRGHHLVADRLSARAQNQGAAAHIDPVTQGVHDLRQGGFAVTLQTSGPQTSQLHLSDRCAVSYGAQGRAQHACGRAGQQAHVQAQARSGGQRQRKGGRRHQPEGRRIAEGHALERHRSAAAVLEGHGLLGAGPGPGAVPGTAEDQGIRLGTQDGGGRGHRRSDWRFCRRRGLAALRLRAAGGHRQQRGQGPAARMPAVGGVALGEAAHRGGRWGWWAGREWVHGSLLSRFGCSGLTDRESSSRWYLVCCC
ncbi:hypothetical protein DEFR109230_18520 [Deinococcus frigens]